MFKLTAEALNWLKLKSNEVNREDARKGKEVLLKNFHLGKWENFFRDFVGMFG